MSPLESPELYETFRVSSRGRESLRDFMESALRAGGCTLIHTSAANEAPFRLSFLTPWGERIGIVAYAFLANSRPTKNRPSDEHRFQVKYGSKDGKLHPLWQDPFGLYVTLFLGIDPEAGFFVGADPVLNSPTRFFISKEFKRSHVDAIEKSGWHAWERDQRRAAVSDPVEIFVGGKAEHFLRYVLFEREARGEEQGNRQLVAEEIANAALGSGLITEPFTLASAAPPAISDRRLHALEREFDLGSDDILELISRAPRLKMAVRGWVAERHLQQRLESITDVKSVESIEADGQPDFRIEMRRGRHPVLVECKNVLRTTDRVGHPRLDFMRTRAALGDPCSRYYSPREFDVLAACLHANSGNWDFAARRTNEMLPHPTCAGKLSHRVIVDDAWERDLAAILTAASG
jgi:hypothetical protein